VIYINDLPDGLESTFKMHVGNGSEKVTHGVTEAKMDLLVIIANNCKNNLQAEISINRADYELGRVRKTFQFFNVKRLRILTFIRPHLV